LEQCISAKIARIVNGKDLLASPLGRLETEHYAENAEKL